LTGDVFRVVFVCTGNRFRSPLAAALLEREADGLPIEVSSVGTLDLGGVEALPEAVEAAARFGVELSQHRTRALSPERLRDADLVVGFERMHVMTAVVDAGVPRQRAFTLPELVSLLPSGGITRRDGSAARARESVRRAAAARPRDPQLASAAELRDPLGLPAQQQNETADRVRELTRLLLRGLFG
jgi:protein-tyrosine phosphatase